MKMFKIYIPRSVPAGDSSIGIPEMLKTIRRNVRKFIGYRPDEYVLVHGQEIVGRFDSFGSGIKEGYQRFKLDPFLVQKVRDVVEPVRMPKTWHSFASLVFDLFRGDLFVALHPRH